MPNRASKGITLVELVAMLAIIGVVAAVIIPTVWSAPNRAERDYKADQERLQYAVESYYDEMHTITDRDGRTASGFAFPTYMVDTNGETVTVTGEANQTARPTSADVIPPMARWTSTKGGSWINVNLLIQAGLLSDVPDSCHWSNTFADGTLSGTNVTMAPKDWTPSYYQDSAGYGTYAWYVDANGKVQSQPTFTGAGRVYP